MWSDHGPARMPTVPGPARVGDPRPRPSDVVAVRGRPARHDGRVIHRLVGAVAVIAAAHVIERRVEQIRLTCRECKRPMWGGQRRPYCASTRCSIGRRNLDRARAKAERSRTLRTRPPWPFARVLGACNLCGVDVVKPRRSWCGDRCVQINDLAGDRKTQLKHLMGFYDRCWSCDSWGPLEVDHVRPLWSLTDHERTEFRWWLPFNLQLLCTDCHKVKTAREAAERAAIART